MSTLNVNNITKYTGGEVVVNDASEDVDFRVESDGNANMIFVDGGNNTVGIGTASPTGILHVDGHTGSIKSVFEGNGSGDEVPVQLLVKANNGSTSTQGLYGSAGSTSVDNTITLGASSSSGVKVDSYGHVTKPLQPAFYAEIAGGNQDNIAIDTAVTVLLNSEAFDIGSDFNTGTYTFTAPASGKYHFSVKLECNNVDAAASYYQVKLSTSNKAIYLGSWAFNGYSADATYFALSGSCTCDMDASDTASVEITQGGGTAQTDLNNGTYMTGHLVC
jgi:hypothetical protein